MTRRESFRARLADRSPPLTGVFVKLPSHQAIELVASSGADVAVIDLEHAPIGPVELDAMLAMAHALDLPCLVRVSEPVRAMIQHALDGGAVGVVVPHVDSPQRAADVVRWSHYGPGGRGYSGSTRAAGWGAPAMASVLAVAAAQTTVIVQVEDPAALDHLDEIAGTAGVDAVFVGTADLTVALGHDDVTADEPRRAVHAILAAADRAARPVAVYAADVVEAAEWRERGATLVCVGSDQSRLRSGSA